MDEDVDDVGVTVGDAVAAGDALDASCSVSVVSLFVKDNCKRSIVVCASVSLFRVSLKSSLRRMISLFASSNGVKVGLDSGCESSVLKSDFVVVEGILDVGRKSLLIGLAMVNLILDICASSSVFRF